MTVKLITYYLSIFIFVILALGLFNSNTSYAQRYVPRAVVDLKIDEYKNRQRETYEEGIKHIESIDDIGKLKQEARQVLDKLNVEFKELANRSEEAKEEVAILGKFNENIYNQKEELGKEKEELGKENVKIIEKKQFYKKGFYGFLSAIIIGIIGVIIRAPTIFLDIKLKNLEIIEKEYQMKKKNIKIEQQDSILHRIFPQLKN